MAIDLSHSRQLDLDLDLVIDLSSGRQLDLDLNLAMALDLTCSRQLDLSCLIRPHPFVHIPGPQPQVRSMSAVAFRSRSNLLN